MSACGGSFVNSPSCADNPKNKSLLQKIICQGQQNTVDSITLALLTSATVPAVIAQTAKWIRCGKPSKGAPYAYGALALWGLEVARSLNNIHNDEKNLGENETTGFGVSNALSSTEENYSPGDDVIKLINSATNRINSFLGGSLCSNATASPVFGLCGACSLSDTATAEFCGNCQGITLKLLNNEVKPKFGKNNFIWGDTKEFYNKIINANDDELWKIIYTSSSFSPLWEELKPNPDAVWNYSNGQLTLKAGGSGYNFCNSNQSPSPF